jgi:hypothetical protein
MRDPQLQNYLNRPDTYPLNDLRVRLALRHTDKPCVGEPCDEFEPCKRHNRTHDLVMRATKRIAQDN